MTTPTTDADAARQCAAHLQTALDELDSARLSIEWGRDAYPDKEAGDPAFNDLLNKVDYVSQYVRAIRVPCLALIGDTDALHAEASR